LFATFLLAYLLTYSSSSSLQEAMASNLVLAIYGFSKMNACREFLMAPPILIDRAINKLSMVDNPKIKANCGRAYKNFNSDLNEAIEEGAVASLIAMSLEGKLKNQSSDEFTLPDVLPQVDKKLPAPACVDEISPTPTDAQWFEKVKVTNGGAAGKGPDPPEPPTMTIDGSSEYPNMAEELDAGEIEGKTKMAFAKMQVPQNVKESHLLSDTDFMLNVDRENEDNNNTVDGGGGDARSVNSNDGDPDAASNNMDDESGSVRSRANSATHPSGSAGSNGGGVGANGRSASFVKRASRGNSMRSLTGTRTASNKHLGGGGGGGGSGASGANSVDSGAGGDAGSVGGGGGGGGSTSHSQQQQLPPLFGTTVSVSPEPGLSTSSASPVQNTTTGSTSGGGGGTNKKKKTGGNAPLKPIAQHAGGAKEPTMAEQAARLGLFT
jgi:hypothetical protein